MTSDVYFIQDKQTEERNRRAEMNSNITIKKADGRTFEWTGKIIKLENLPEVMQITFESIHDGDTFEHTLPILPDDELIITQA